MTSFRSRLREPTPLVGTILTLPSPELAEICAQAGFDFLWLDMEHGLLEVKDVQRAVMAAGSTPCLVRVPVNQEAWIKRALDTGAAGVILPQVNSAAEARDAVRWSRYPPEGARSVGIGRAQGYGAGLSAYVETANRETAVLVQVEHVRALENLDAILAADGLDGVIVGPYDLSASMGMTGQVTRPEVVAAVKQVREACSARGIPVGVFAADAVGAGRALADGFRLVAAGMDSLVFSRAMRAMRAEIKPG